MTRIIPAAVASTAGAQSPEDRKLTACKATARRRCARVSSSVKDIVLDLDTRTVAKVEDTPMRTIVMGDAYLERKETGKSQRFLCLVGEKGNPRKTAFLAAFGI